MPCKKCGKDPKNGLLEGLCADCIYSIGSGLKQLSKEELKRARAVVEAETEGLFAPELLMGILEDFADRIEDGDDRNEAALHAMNEIQRLGGLGMCKEILRLGDGILELGNTIQDEVRRKIRILSNLK